MLEFHKIWFELFVILVMVMGIAVALAAPSAIISYIIIFISGMFAGRLIYERKNKIQFPFFVIIAGFAIGYMIGVYYGSRSIAIGLFVIGAVLSYKLFDKKILKDTKF